MLCIYTFRCVHTIIVSPQISYKMKNTILRLPFHKQLYVVCNIFLKYRLLNVQAQQFPVQEFFSQRKQLLKISWDENLKI